MTRVVLIVWLTVLWVALWQDISVGNVLGGLCIALLVVYVSGQVPPGSSVFRPIACAHLVVYFLSQLVGSTVAVARAVLAPRRFVHPEVVTVELHVTSDSLLAVVAAAITATPGTLAVDATLEPPAVTVHVLDGRDPDRVRANVGRLEALVEAAFGERAPTRRRAS
jgi:multicomponent Na+:H+ antiporter subunit E